MVCLVWHWVVLYLWQTTLSSTTKACLLSCSPDSWKHPVSFRGAGHTDYPVASQLALVKTTCKYTMQPPKVLQPHPNSGKLPLDKSEDVFHAFQCTACLFVHRIRDLPWISLLCMCPWPSPATSPCQMPASPSWHLCSSTPQAPGAALLLSQSASLQVGGLWSSSTATKSDNPGSVDSTLAKQHFSETQGDHLSCFC